MKRTTQPSLTRRGFFASTGAAALAAAAPAKASVEAGSASDFVYEVNRTTDEWYELLGEQSFAIMREGFTEAQKSSPLWEETRKGDYQCKGCDLKIYSGAQKVVLDKGWVFFYHSEPDTLMTAIDGEVAAYGSMADGAALIELHCRRCASHMGHLVIVAGGMKHCINGAALNFIPDAA